MPTTPIRKNIDEIRCLEEKALQNRSWSEKFGDWVAEVSGTMGFVWFNAIWYASWILLNVKLIPGLKPFDPFPFTFLTLCVSLEAIFLSVFVLMSQNRMARQSDLRSHLDLQINLLGEAETTRILDIVSKIAEKMDLQFSTELEIQELKKPAPVQQMFEELKQELPQNFDSN